MHYDDRGRALSLFCMKTLFLSVSVFLVANLAISGQCRAQSTIDTGVPKEPIAMATDMFLPNAFSPNGDGLNDKFTPLFSGKKHYTLYSFRIFNRSGQEVYNTGNSVSGWDGTFKGQPAESGSYAYYLQVFGDDGKEKVLTGYVALIR
jgi:gliding motility-associated-like protein